MGSIYLTDMANWLRAAGLSVIEYAGWQTRARGSGGYTQNPLCVMWHHTASPPSWDGQKDADYCAVGDPDAPVSNLYIERSGTVWVLAGGATNTNGKGRAITFSRGTVQADCMNSNAVGVEMGNDGIGEMWPQAQIDAMFIVSNTVNSYLGNIPDDISTHQFYAPDRKIDPATDNVQGPWVPAVVNSAGSWDRADVQDQCRVRAGGTLPPPIPKGLDVAYFIVQPVGDTRVFITDYVWKRHINGEEFAHYQNLSRLGYPYFFDSQTGAQINIPAVVLANVPDAD